jgi:hypothetical protein
VFDRSETACKTPISLAHAGGVLQGARLGVLKNKQPTHTPGGPGRLRSWSGPVETDFQGRLRFSYDSRPGDEERGGGKEGVRENIMCHLLRVVLVNQID